MSLRLSSPKHRLRLAIIAVVVLIFVFILVRAWTALVPFFIGTILAYLLLPAVNYLDSHSPKALQNKNVSRPIAIAVVYVVLLALAAGFISYFVPVIGEQAKVLVAAVPGYIARLQELFEYDIARLLESIPPDIRAAFDANLQQNLGSITRALQRGLAVTMATLSQTISFIIGLVIIPFWLFYVLNDEGKGRRIFFGMMPEEIRADVHHIAALVDRTMRSYIQGQFLLCLVVGAMATVALFALGVNLALLLGTFAGIFEIIPFLGPYLGAIPAILVALADRPIIALWVAVAFAAIQQIENIFLVPRISGSAVRFHPAIVMVIIVVASELAGLLGVLIAVPLAAMVRDVLRYLYLRTTPAGDTPEKAFALVCANLKQAPDAAE